MSRGASSGRRLRPRTPARPHPSRRIRSRSAGSASLPRPPAPPHTRGRGSGSAPLRRGSPASCDAVHGARHRHSAARRRHPVLPCRSPGRRGSLRLRHLHRPVLLRGPRRRGLRHDPDLHVELPGGGGRHDGGSALPADPQRARRLLDPRGPEGDHRGRAGHQLLKSGAPPGATTPADGTGDRRDGAR